MFVDIFQEDSVCVVLKGIAEVIRIMNVEIVSLEISVSFFVFVGAGLFCGREPAADGLLDEFRRNPRSHS